MGFGKPPLQGYESNRRHADGVRLDTYSQESQLLGLLVKIQSQMRDLQCEPEHFKDRIIFMSMYNDMGWGEKGNTERCEHNPQTVVNYARKFHRGHWSFQEPGSEKKWYGPHTGRPDGSWDKIAERMMMNFSESSHPIFRASSAFERGELRSKGGGRKSVHFNGSDKNIELILRTVISANHLSVYGAIADLCKELSEVFVAPVKPEAPDDLDTTEIPSGLSIAGTHTNEQQQGNLVQEYE